MIDNSTTRSGAVAQSETGSLIAASKVEGTSVYNRQGESLGSVDDLMIDKRSGKVSDRKYGRHIGIPPRGL
jgi:sporulation protein YlmC with PRC-barrel domain